MTVFMKFYFWLLKLVIPYCNITYSNKILKKEMDWHSKRIKEYYEQEQQLKEKKLLNNSNAIKRDF